MQTLPAKPPRMLINDVSALMACKSVALRRGDVDGVTSYASQVQTALDHSRRPSALG